MANFVPVLLTIHILTAIVAFGPTFAFPLMARMAASQPQHSLFVLHLTERIEKRMTIPLALTMPVSGGLLVWAEGIEVSSAGWLVLAIVLYLVAMTYAVLVQVRSIDRMIELAEGLAADRAVADRAVADRAVADRANSEPAASASAPSANPQPAAAPPASLQPAFAAGPGAALATRETLEAGRAMAPAAELARLGARVRNGGILLAVLIVLIVSLMAGKPAI